MVCRRSALLPRRSPSSDAACWRFEDGGRDVDDVVNWERISPLALIPSASGRPCRCGCRPSARRPASSTGTGVSRVRPADRVVVVGFGRAKSSIFDAINSAAMSAGAVEDDHLVEQPCGVPSARAVVADDVEDQRVVQDAEVLERVTSRPTRGRCTRRSRRRPPSGAPRAASRRASRPRPGISSGRGVSWVSSGTMPSFFWRASVSSRSLSQPSSNLPLYLSDHSFGT